MQYTLTRKDGDDEIEYLLEIWWTGTKGHPHSNYPDDPPEVEIKGIRWNGQPFYVTDSEMDKIEEACYNVLVNT